MNRHLAPSADHALRRVGLTVENVLTLGGSVLEAGPAYLVGSLAGGLGNQGSDVDIHLLVPGIERPVPAFLFFSGDTPIDIEHYPETMPTRMLEAVRAFPTAKLPIARVSLAPPLDRRARRAAARWLNSVPLRAGLPPVFDPVEATTMLASVVRTGLDQMVKMWAVARLAAIVDGAGSARARYLFGRTGRELLELRCRAHGDVVTSEKWLPDRATRNGFDANTQRNHYQVTDERDLVELLWDTGMADWDPWWLTRVRPAPGRSEVKLGQERFLRNRHGRLLRDPITVTGSLHEATSAQPPHRLLTALRDAELELHVPTEALKEAINA